MTYDIYRCLVNCVICVQVSVFDIDDGRLFRGLICSSHSQVSGHCQQIMYRRKLTIQSNWNSGLWTWQILGDHTSLSRLQIFHSIWSHAFLQNFSNVGNSLDSQLIVSPTSTPSTTPFVPPAFQNLRNSVNLDLDATQATLKLNWGKNPLFARNSFAPVFTELRGNRLEEENEKIGHNIVVTLHPEEALARKAKSRISS